MPKLKCWKQQKPNSFNGKLWWKRKDKLDDTTQRYEVTVGGKHAGEYPVFLPTKVIRKERKSDAVKAAMDFMKDHDSC